jgi:hypothetical protein
MKEIYCSGDPNQDEQASVGGGVNGPELDPSGLDGAVLPRRRAAQPGCAGTPVTLEEAISALFPMDSQAERS